MSPHAESQSTDALRLSIAIALRELRAEIRWKPGKAEQHLAKRVRRGHLIADSTLVDYEQIIKMNELHDLIEAYQIDVDSPEVSGFEHLEMLDRRSEIALREVELTDQDRGLLEETDRRFFRRAEVFYKAIADVADLAEMRQRVRPMPSHWWWYLDELVESFGRLVEHRRAEATVAAD